MRYLIKETRFNGSRVVRYLGQHGVDTLSPLEPFETASAALDAMRSIRGEQRAVINYIVVPVSVAPAHVRERAGL